VTVVRAARLGSVLVAALAALAAVSAAADAPLERPGRILSVELSDSPTALWLGREAAALGAQSSTSAFPTAHLQPWAEGLGLHRFMHLEFEDASGAQSAVDRLAAIAGVRSVTLLSEPRLGEMADDERFSKNLSPPPSASLPNDPYCHNWPWGYPEDAQWGLFNHGKRDPVERCGRAVAGADVGAAALWQRRADAPPLGGSAAPARWIGAPEVVIGFLDVGIRDDHPDLAVLSDYSRIAPYTICPSADWCGDHATKMAGLAAARGDNGQGVAGVCSDCSVLDFTMPACACPNCDLESENCNFVSPLWASRLVEALPLSLGRTEGGRERQLSVVCAAFVSASYASIEAFAAVQAARRAGVLIVAATGDHSLATPVPRSPANIPGVLGVGGSTWEDRFWDARVSCYPGSNGSTLGDGVIDLCAPASGKTISTFIYPNPNGAGLYANTTGQCSGAAAQVAGAAGVLQAEALYRSGREDWLTPDDLAGALVTTARSFAHDPTLDPTCPPSLCPREMYGPGVVDLENAAYLVRHASEWREEVFDEGRGWSVERLSPALVFEGSTWWEYRIVVEWTVPRRWDDGGAPADLPWHLAWSRGERSSAPVGYGAGAERVRYAQTGATDCAVAVDPATGIATVTATNFTRVVDGVEVPLVPWDRLKVRVGWWAGPATPRDRGPDAEQPEREATDEAAAAADVAGSLRLDVSPNPSSDGVAISWTSPRPFGRLSAEIFDAAGRLVRRLAPGYPSARSGALTWDGRDAHGKRAPAGLYWVRLWLDDETITRPLVRATGAE